MIQVLAEIVEESGSIRIVDGMLEKPIKSFCGTMCGQGKLHLRKLILKFLQNQFTKVLK